MTKKNELCYIGKVDDDLIELWHQRYDYLGYDNLKLLKDREMVNVMDDIKKNINRNCEGCAIGKQHRVLFRKKLKNTSIRLLELIHRDFCTPIDLILVGGSKYFVNFVDDFLRYVMVYMMKQKSKVLNKFREFVNMGVNCTGLKVERLRSDNSRKTSQRRLMNFLKVIAFNAN